MGLASKLEVSNSKKLISLMSYSLEGNIVKILRSYIDKLVTTINNHLCKVNNYNDHVEAEY